MTDQVLLEKVRQIHRVFLASGLSAVDLTEHSRVLCGVLEAGVVITDAEGIVRGCCFPPNEFPAGLAAGFKRGERPSLWSGKEPAGIEKPAFNLKADFLAAQAPCAVMAIIPLLGNDSRLGTMFLFRPAGEFDINDVLLAEIGSTMTGLSMMHVLAEKEQDQARFHTMITVALESLSYSEIEAIEEIFRQLKGAQGEGVIIASKIADELGITRSVIVNALRKFESAGIIESRSLGMKGTFVKLKTPQMLQKISSFLPKLQHMTKNG